MALAAPASAQQVRARRQPLQIIATSPDAKPPGFRLSGGRSREGRRARARGAHASWRRAGLDRLVAVPGYTGDPYRWQVTYSRDGTGVVEVHVNGRTGRVLEVWTGPQVDFLLARPWKDKTGGALNHGWIWIPLCLLFLAPFFDSAPPVPAAAPGPARAARASASRSCSSTRASSTSGCRRSTRCWSTCSCACCWPDSARASAGSALVPYARESWLLAGLVLLVVGRIVLNVVDSDVIDVGYRASSAPTTCSTAGDISGYGPLMFLAYVPFELIFPWHGTLGRACPPRTPRRSRSTC